MNTSSVAVRAHTWLSSTWHIKVPDQWLRACIDWIKQENNAGNLSQAEINKQIYEQWLLTDLRDLEFPVLPDSIMETPKCELNGFYSIQIDSLIDVSQPAYSQLQKLRGKNNTNEQVSASSQKSQKPWEAKPTRMLLLMLTDGMQRIQGMEYQPIPVLHSNISPGTKIMLQGKIACRLGVLLLKPENVKVLGGEVETLVDEYSQRKVLARLIGEEEKTPPIQPINPVQSALEPVDEIGQSLGPSDEELLASLDENVEFTMNNEISSESGYCSRSDHSATPSAALPSNGIDVQQSSGVIFQGGMRTIHTDDGPLEDSVIDLDDFLGDECDLLDDLFLEEEIQKELEEPGMCQPQIMNGNRDMPTAEFTDLSLVSHDSPLCSPVLQTRGQNDMHKNLDSPPFTYLSVLLARNINTVKTVQIKSFIVTLNGNLSNSSGFWSIKAKISDGTAYLDVDFKDEVLTKLIGFSVSDMKRLKKDPNQHQQLTAGLQKCQRELIDLCCLMTITFNPSHSSATVLSLQDVNMEVAEDLKKRLNTY
ncbi:recQ-mediated genome instability protein 1 [Rhinatrema bivittatum]|uniref:recQ-mediated genome instability protein 1 n=1 Tax=Rhinatrema bivittatum TaxID=194408 RepID=UPI00112A2689|nr:recQ-mediated genome instability protein 1 [Rhinatrema bivittatum]XP_029473218.1 recQ-mediated genome instability protein 1 [Rhinatrema bivittatum]XP_029473224.1 recQ-mediated genome instability protein 1 [Rhinatrema bivittatum]XP_029473228.1 recQ-mediated genome instability protein 1 [Rhinatrema bivittatum]XP_029473233.1 recQ-mediated genome instability protein 1 [Rhinatrema bivittatum]XP_029473239.1 recQ-mediated genome instability protein 1 [Rhinatrema bivittatum]XP_029473247.1 recQ-med